MWASGTILGLWSKLRSFVVSEHVCTFWSEFGLLKPVWHLGDSGRARNRAFQRQPQEKVDKLCLKKHTILKRKLAQNRSEILPPALYNFYEP